MHVIQTLRRQGRTPGVPVSVAILTVIVVIRGWTTLGQLRDDPVVLLDIIERVEIVVVRPGLHVDPDLVLVSLGTPSPAELHTEVVVLRSLLWTDPTHDTPVRDQGGYQSNHTSSNT